MLRPPSYRPTMRQYRYVLSALKDLHKVSQDVAERMDVTNVGRCRWRLLRASDNAAAVIRAAEQPQ